MTHPGVRSDLSATGADLPDAALGTASTMKLIIVLLVGFTIWLWLPLLRSAPLENALYQLDVGQGDATLLVLTDPTRTQPITVLIDGGSGSQILSQIAHALPHNHQRIDLMILTHPDLDHFGGLTPLLNRYPVGAFVSTGVESDAEAFNEFITTVRDLEIPMFELFAYDTIRFGEHTFRLIAPTPEQTSLRDSNEASLVLQIVIGAPARPQRILLTGDIGLPTEHELLNVDLDLSAEILKVGHHGSRFSTSEQFVAAVAPTVAIIGVGSNRYGHPHDEVLHTLDRAGAHTYRTDLDGTIKVALDADAAHASRARPTFLHSTFAASLLTGAYKTRDQTIISLEDLPERAGTLVPYTTCSYAGDQDPTRATLVLNEVAWMGAPSGATHEWIELRNLTSKPLDLSGWQLINENERIHLTFPQGTILHDELGLIARESALPTLGRAALATFTGSIRNSTEGLRLFDATCTLIDDVYATPQWGAGDNAGKFTMERSSDLGWHTSSVVGGTPGTPNTIPPADPSAQTDIHGSQNQIATVAPPTTGCIPGQININTASHEQLVTLRHIGNARAHEIIAGRPFRNLADLARIRGLGGSRIHDIVSEGKACAS